MYRKLLIIIAITTSVFHSALLQAGGILSGSIWEAVAESRIFTPEILYSVALKESRRLTGAGKAAPYPWTLRTKQGGKVYPDKSSAIQALKQALTDNTPRQLDIGLMQINLHYHQHRINRPEDLLDPAISIVIAADILEESIKLHPDDIALGIGRYYTSDSALARQYGADVLRIADQLSRLNPKM